PSPSSKKLSTSHTRRSLTCPPMRLSRRGAQQSQRPTSPSAKAGDSTGQEKIDMPSTDSTLSRPNLTTRLSVLQQPQGPHGRTLNRWPLGAATVVSNSLTKSTTSVEKSTVTL